MIAYADFFTGIAGCVIAAELAGFTPVSFCEIEEFPRRLLKHYWPEVPILHDIRTVTADDVRGIGRIDVAHFSPPCQSLSIAGKQEATEDLRYLWPDTARVISLLRPTWVVVENVDNAVNLVLDDWIADLDGLGYETAPIVLPAAAVGAPHIRNRVFLVAHAERDESERWGGSGELGSTSPADESETREREWLRDTLGHSRTAMANPEGFGMEGDGSGRVAITNLPTEASISRRLSAGRGVRESWPVEDPTGQRRRPAGRGEGEFADGAGALSWVAGSDTRDATEQPVASRLGANGVTELKPRLGGNADVFPGVLDGYTLRGLTWNGWPAGKGPHQYDDEPPRTGGKLKERRPRIKAIGNAVPPAQIYPIFKAIAHEIRACQP